MNLNSTVRFVADGTVSVVNLTYKVHAGDEVQVFFNDARIMTGWTLNSSAQPQRVQFTSNIPAGTNVLIRRYTDMREIPHVFHTTGNGQGGAEFNAQNLDENLDLVLRAAQDAMDSFELIGVNIEAAFDAQTYADAALASKNAAALSASQALTSKNDAVSSASAALTSRNQASGFATTASGHAGTATTKANEASASAGVAQGHKEAAAVSAGDANTSKLAAASSAVDANTAKNQANQSKTDAQAAANAASLSEDAAESAASTATSAKNAASSSALAASGSATLAGNSATVATTKAGEALSSANAAISAKNTANDHAVAAAGSASTANTRANNAGTSATNALASENAAAGHASTASTKAGDSNTSALASAASATTALGYRNQAETHKNNAATSATLAQDWANEDVDVPVTTGPDQFSAKHWAIKAADIVQSDISITTGNTTSVAMSGNGTLLDPLKANVLAVPWGDVSGKPSSFTPATHAHTWASITGKPTTFAPAVHTHLWADITDKPSVFPTSWATVTGKPTTFVSAWADITGKPSTYTPVAHTHPWGDVTGKPSSYPTTWSDIATKPSTFPPESHGHAWGDITGKPTEFTPSSHNQPWSTITSKPTTFPPEAHTHPVGQITGAGSAIGYNVGTGTNQIPLNGYAGINAIGETLAVMNPTNHPSGFYKYDNTTASKITALGVRGAVFNIQQDWNTQSQAQLVIPHDDYRTIMYRAGTDKVWEYPTIRATPVRIAWTTVAAYTLAMIERKTTTGQRVRPVNGYLDISWEAHVHPWRFNTNPSSGGSEISIEVWVQPVGGVEAVMEPHVKAYFPDNIGDVGGSTTHPNSHLRNMAGRKFIDGLDPTKLYDVKIKILRVGAIAEYTLHYLHVTIVP